MVVREGKTPVISGVFRLSPDNQTDNRLDNRPATGADFLLLPPRGKFKLLHFLRCQLPLLFIMSLISRISHCFGSSKVVQSFCIDQLGADLCAAEIIKKD
jgi:hypothetical protein